MFNLLEYYLDQYQSSGGKFLSNQNWVKACNVAFVQYGMTLLLPFAGMVLKDNANSGLLLVDPFVERVNHALADLNLDHG